MSNVIAFPSRARVAAFPRGPLGQRPVVACLEQRVDVILPGGTLYATDLPLKDAVTVGSIRDVAAAIGALERCGEAIIAGGVTLRLSSTDGRGGSAA